MSNFDKVFRAITEGSSIKGWDNEIVFPAMYVWCNDCPSGLPMRALRNAVMMCEVLELPYGVVVHHGRVCFHVVDYREDD